MRGVAERRRAPGGRTWVAGTEDPPNADAAGPLFRTPCSRAAILVCLGCTPSNRVRSSGLPGPDAASARPAARNIPRKVSL